MYERKHLKRKHSEKTRQDDRALVLRTFRVREVNARVLSRFPSALSGNEDLYDTMSEMCQDNLK